MIEALLIGNDPEDAALLSSLLETAEEHPCRLRSAHTLSSGLGLLAHGGIDVVLLDLGLPDCDGLETFLRVRDRAPDVPTIVLMDSQNNALAIEAARHGAQGYLLKGTADGDGVYRAITHAIARQNFQRAVRESEERLHLLVEVVQDYAIFMLDPEGKVATWNLGAQRLYGCVSDEILGQDPSPVVRMPLEDTSDLRPGLVAALRDGRYEAQGWCERRDGSRFWADVVITALRSSDGDLRGYSFIARDSTNRRQTEETLERMALHDPLTGLPNRTLFLDRLGQAIREGTRNATPQAVCVLDLDGFKTVNDSLGHQAGDLILREAGGRLERSLRQWDTVARIGGDEFAILLPATDGPGASQAALKVLRAFDRPFRVREHIQVIRMSVGIAIWPIHGQDAEALIDRADAAMYVAKRSGSGCALYIAEPGEAEPRSLTIYRQRRRRIGPAS